MFKTDYGLFDPDSWEKQCQIVFKTAYAEELYQRMRDANGDYGIEGFTLKTGKAFQCYCPENDIRGEELYKALRSKITNDILKLDKYSEDLKKVLGDTKIKEWYLVTPKNGDKKIFAHCRKKEKEILKKNLEIIDKDFTIVIREVEDYVSYLKFTKIGISFEASIDEAEKNEYANEQNIYIDNAKRKYNKVYEDEINNISDLEKGVLKATDMSVARYLRGKKQLEFLRINHPRDYERFNKFIAQLEEDVVMDSLGSIQNKKEFIKSSINNVENKLKTELLGYDSIMIKDLANQVVSRWILECSLNFI